MPVLFAHWGDEGIRGSERVLLDLFAELDRRRFAARLWCNSEAMAQAARELDVAACVDRMPILFGWDPPKFDFAGYRRLFHVGRRLIRAHGARVVHVNAGAPNQWLVPAARAAKVPLLAHLHGHYVDRDRCTLLLQQAPVVVGCCESVLAPLRADSVPDSRLRVIHNGVDIARLSEGDARDLRRRLNIGSAAFLVAGVGALIPLKGFDTAIRAIASLRARRLDAHLVLMGVGPEHDALAALARECGIAEQVHFLGHQRHVGAILRDAADVLVIASTIEALPLSAAEAGAMGRATVATRVGGMAEIIADGKTGILVPPRDVAAMADALETIARDPALGARLGDAARARVQAEFTTGRVARSFESLYEELAAQPMAAFGWRRLGFRVAPFARLATGIVGRRLGLRPGSA